MVLAECELGFSGSKRPTPIFLDMQQVKRSLTDHGALECEVLLRRGSGSLPLRITAKVPRLLPALRIGTLFNPAQKAR